MTWANWPNILVWSACSLSTVLLCLAFIQKHHWIRLIYFKRIKQQIYICISSQQITRNIHLSHEKKNKTRQTTRWKDTGKKTAHRFFEHVHYFRQKFIIGINLLVFIAFLKDAATTKKRTNHARSTHISEWSRSVLIIR